MAEPHDAETAHREPVLIERMRSFGTTVFAEMTVLANQTGSFNLGQGFPDTPTPPAVIAAATEAMARGVNQYTHPLGEPVLRQAISAHQARFWAMEIDPDTEVLVTAGATEAIAATILSIIDVGDEVIVFEPYFDSYAAVIALAGASRKVVTLREPQDPSLDPTWWIDFDEVRSAVGPRTKAILLNTPHNPTGKVLSVGEIEQFAAIAREHDLIVISDEVYEHLAFDRPHVPVATVQDLWTRTVTISSGGKTLSCTGWKIGWVSGPANLIAAVRSTKQFLTYVNGGPLQYGVAAGLGLSDEFFAELAASMVARRDRLTAGLRRVGFAPPRADGGYFVMTDIGDLGLGSAREFCLELPHVAGVVAIPSDVFCDDESLGNRYVRWAFCKSDEVIDGAVAALERWGASL